MRSWCVSSRRRTRADATSKESTSSAEIGRYGADGSGLDTYLDSLVPGITARAAGPDSGANR
jgi:hypothetical protein